MIWLTWESQLHARQLPDGSKDTYNEFAQPIEIPE